MLLTAGVVEGSTKGVFRSPCLIASVDVMP